MTILELQQKRAKAYEDMKVFLDDHRGENHILSAEDDGVYNKMEQDFENLSKEIKRLEKLEIIENALNQPSSRPVTVAPEHGSSEKTGIASNEYKEGLLQAFRSKFRNVSNVLQVGVDTDGGYLVPTEMDSRLIAGLDDLNIMRKLGHIMKTSGTHEIPLITTKPTASWVTEGGAIPISDVKFGNKSLKAHKMTAQVKITEELLQDSAFDLERFLEDSFITAITEREEEAFLQGVGTNQPLGVFHDSEGGTHNGDSSSTELTMNGLISMVYTLKRAYRQKASFLINDMNVMHLRKLKDDNGQYVWQPSTQQGQPDRLLGYPVYTSNFVPTNATAFGDFSYYNIADRGTRSFRQLTELYAETGKVAFLSTQRVDGVLTLKEAVQILDHKNVSVTLD